MNRELLRATFSSAPFRIATRAILCIFSFASRAASVLRTAALFDSPQPPICHWTVTVKCPEKINFGSGVIVGPNTTLGAAGGIAFHDHVRISEGVIIETAGLDFRGPPPYPHIARPIVLERGVWVGARAIILGGVTIGEYSIVGAGAVVTRSVPAHSVVVGARASVLPKASGKTFELADEDPQ
jgi:maltose O-acetyltransferase